MSKKKNYETPFIKSTQIEMEDSFCAGSEISIDPKKPNLEVDEYNSIENEVTFE